MKSKLTLLLLTFLTMSCTHAQDKNMNNEKQAPALPYYEIPDAPESYSPGNVAARMIDGLGFRYYWATEGLRDEDLKFQPNAEARTSEQTIDHIYRLSRTIVNATKKNPNIRSSDEPEMTFEGKRKATLENFQTASNILKACEDKEMEEFLVIFKRGDSTSEFPFWNLINGPIADAIWHVGQVVSFRRSSGNPFNSKASVFSGKLRK